MRAATDSFRRQLKQVETFSLCCSASEMRLHPGYASHFAWQKNDGADFLFSCSRIDAIAASGISFLQIR
jgi:hypothetical protein